MVRNVTVALLTVLLAVAAPMYAAAPVQEISKSIDAEAGLVVVIGGGADTADIAAGLGNGDRLVHVIASDYAELKRVNDAVAKANLKGCVTVEVLGLATLPYRDHLVNAMVITDADKAAKAGLKMEEATRSVIPEGVIVQCRGGKVQVTRTPVRNDMDVWTHRYHAADGVPVSNDKVFAMPIGFKWNADLPMNFDNPERAANRYSSTRALIVDDGRIFTFSECVVENLGEGVSSKFGTDQYLTCRDAFNGRLLWRKNVGDTYYGGLYIENTAPLISTGRRLYTAGANGKMEVLDTRSGETVRELPTKFIPGVIAASQGVVVTTTWSGGKQMGSVKHYDRRRMDWEISAGTVEAYDDATGKLLWKNDTLGTSLLIADGTVFIVNRNERDALEAEHNKRREGVDLKHPPQKVIAYDLKTGKQVWSVDDTSFNVSDQPLSLESAGRGAVAVGLDGRSKVAILAADSGKLLEADALKEANDYFFRFRNHICTPVLRVGDVVFNNRGGNIKDGKSNTNFGGARAACLTGTVPAYGAGYIAQNWCRCSPGQIPGLLGVAPIGKVPTPEEMEVPTQPIKLGDYSEGEDGVAHPSNWTSFRGNAERSSSVAMDVPDDVKESWSVKLAGDELAGTIQRDWQSYLNSRLTAPVLADNLAIVGDIDHNEIIAFDTAKGAVKWRHMLSGRVDTPPTVYKGIVLIGDHTGYVTALKVKNGQPIYKLRIAPDEKRMMSYGKVESVWPVIGGVLVAEGKAFASAGRTQGSDGGLVVRAFEPETGNPIWAQAIPQSSPELTEKKPKRNDALARHGEFVTVMGHWLRLDNGAFAPKPEGDTLDIGLEGLYSWNWTRLGDRKFMAIGYGSIKGDTIAWNDSYAVTTRHDSSGLIASRVDPKKVRGFPGLPNIYQPTCMVVCNNALIQGGAILDQPADKGFIRAVSLTDGKVLWEKKYTKKLAFNGLAVDNGGILASFDDGSVVCLK
ncbi:MAG: PQQ-binding-like beta-propeller repeat protein [Phycisphaera sp.]|nr:PQQ-binding-like beta-propeller repeat protein [Phycisphaera sp.]